MNLLYIIDDDQSVLSSLCDSLQREGYQVKTFTNPSQCLPALEKETPAVAICDIFFGSGQPDGEYLVKEIMERSPNTQCIMISGESDIRKILSCIKCGALDFFEKPVSLPRLITTVRNAVAAFHAKVNALSKYEMLGTSKAIRDVVSRTRKLALLNESVLVRGENGTGKELVAANLHLYSSRHSMPLQNVNCTALNPNILESELFGHKSGSFTGADKDKKGYFEMASGSSLFIDEIGDFAPNLQSKILRVVQEKMITPVGGTAPVNIDTRLIFATHHDLENLIENGLFRQDLYFRISTFTIHVPPLRDRIEDIDSLAPHFLNTFIKENGLSPKYLSGSALEKLKEYHYPGNIRELAKILKNAAFFTENENITADDICFTVSSRRDDIWGKCRMMTLNDGKTFFEREFLIKRIELNGGDLKRTAESLGMIVNNLYRKLHEHGIKFKE
jgi:two-component system nitrogen regulation response regulator NtrX